MNGHFSVITVFLLVPHVISRTNVVFFEHGQLSSGSL